MNTKAQYKVRNWNAYDAALKQRGSITFLVNEEIIEQWRNQQKTGKKGASNYYSDTAIATMGTIQSVFNLAGRLFSGVFGVTVHAHGDRAKSTRSLHVVASIK
jgi:Transposase DDE domain